MPNNATKDELAAIGRLTTSLMAIKVKQVPYVCLEDIAPKIFRSLLEELKKHKRED